jgi:transposase
MKVHKMATVREVLYQHTKKISVRAIAKSFSMSKTTVSKYIELAKSYGYSAKITDDELQEISIKVEAALYQTTTTTEARGAVMATLLKYKDPIKSWLSESCMTHTQIQRLLAAEGIVASERSINRFIQNQFPKLPKCTVHLITEAGKEGQVDFGYVGMMKNELGELHKAHAFVMTLSHSRHRYVEFVFAQDQVTWAQLHINAFQFFGGVPLRIILDNLKAGVIKPDIFDPTLNETYSELSRFYGFAIDPAKAYKPEHKGKVERSVRIVKEQLIAGKKYSDIRAANLAALIWCKSEISGVICTSIGRKPIDVFNLEEKDKLLDLPSGVFDMPEWTVGKIHRDHHFVAKGNFYSVPTQYIGEEVSIRIGLKTVSAYYKYRIIKTHPRKYGKGEWVTDQTDYPESARHYLEKTPDVCLGLAKAIGPWTHQMIQRITLPGTRVSLRKAQAILRLENKYSKDRLETACQRSISFDNYEYKALCNILSGELDKISSQAQDSSAEKISQQKLNDGSYVRSSEEYTSDMKVNYE